MLLAFLTLYIPPIYIRSIFSVPITISILGSSKVVKVGKFLFFRMRIAWMDLGVGICDETPPPKPTPHSGTESERSDTNLRRRRKEVTRVEGDFPHLQLHPASASLPAECGSIQSIYFFRHGFQPTVLPHTYLGYIFIPLFSQYIVSLV